MTPKFRSTVIRVHTLTIAIAIFVGMVLLALFYRASALDRFEGTLVRFSSPGGITMSLPKSDEIQVYQEWEGLRAPAHQMADSLLFKADIEAVRTSDERKLPFYPGSDNHYSLGNRKGLGLGSFKRIGEGEYTIRAVYNLRAEESLLGTEPQARLALGPNRDTWQRLCEATVFWTIVVSGAIVAFAYAVFAFRFINAVPVGLEEAAQTALQSAEVPTAKPAAPKEAKPDTETAATAESAERSRGKRSPEEREALKAKARAIKEARAKAAAGKDGGGDANAGVESKPVGGDAADAPERPRGKRSAEERAELVAKARAIKESRAKAAAGKGGGEAAPAVPEAKPAGGDAADAPERPRGKRSAEERAELVAKARAIKESRAKAAAAAKAGKDAGVGVAAGTPAETPKVPPMTDEEKLALMSMAKEVAIDQAAANAQDALRASAEEAKLKAAARGSATDGEGRSE